MGLAPLGHYQHLGQAAGFAGIGQQAQALGQHHVLFHQAIDAVGAGINAAMARINHHDFFAAALNGQTHDQLFGGGFALLEVGGPAGIGVELRLLRRIHINHHAVAEAGGWRQHQRIGHPHRAVEVNHHARIAFAEQAVAIGFDRAMG